MKRPVPLPPSFQVDQPTNFDNGMDATPISAADNTFHSSNSEMPTPSSALSQHTEATAPLTLDAPCRDADLPTDARNERLREPLMQHPRLSAQAWEAQGGGHSMRSDVPVNELQIKECLTLTNDLPIPRAPPPDDIACDFSDVNETMTTSMAEVMVSRGLATQHKNLSYDTASDPCWYDLVQQDSYVQQDSRIMAIANAEGATERGGSMPATAARQEAPIDPDVITTLNGGGLG
ncbi:hypothetical protein MTO96_039913 [Rhipicephalus appendiculatus]